MTKDPCAGCNHEYFHCRQSCPDGVKYQDELRQRRERIKKAKHIEDEFTMYRYDKDYQPKTRRREE